MIIKAVSDGGYQANVFSDSLVDDDDLSKLKKKVGFWPQHPKNPVN